MKSWEVYWQYISLAYTPDKGELDHDFAFTNQFLDMNTYCEFRYKAQTNLPQLCNFDWENVSVACYFFFQETKADTFLKRGL